MSTEFSQFNGPGTVQSGDIIVGLRSGTNFQFLLSGLVETISGTPLQIDVTASPNAVISIDPGYLGQTSITTLGTISTGVWQGTDIGVAYGGTGASSFTSYGVVCGGSTPAGNLQSVSSVGTAGQVLTSNGAGALPSFQMTPGGSNTIIPINQPSHGFVVGNVVYFTGTVFALADAALLNEAEVIGIVSSVIDTNDFYLTMQGFVPGLSGLTPGDVYFLSATSAGALTTTEPSTSGYVSKPLLISWTATSGFFFNWRGKVIPAGSWNTVTGNTNMVTNNNYFVNGTANMLLPSASSKGDTIIISNIHASDQFTITQGSGQQIQFANSQTTSGASGSLASTEQGDTVTLVCVTANDFWQATSAVGNLTVT